MNREALVVGINRYSFLKDGKGKPQHLKSAAADAVALAQMLKEHGGFRVHLALAADPADGSLLADGDLISSISPNREDLEEAIGRLFNPPSEIPGEGNDTALLFFAGHGLVKEAGEGFLATSEANGNTRWGVSFKWLRQELLKSKVRQKLVWLDCCHSGKLLNFDEGYLDKLDRDDRDTCLIAASRSFEAAEELPGKHGLLTAALLEALDPDNHEERWVTNYSLMDAIPEKLRTTGQRPVCRSFGSEIVITAEKGQIDSATLKAGVCPYKGLESFDFNNEDPKYFYGRSALVEDLLKRLQKNNFLAVVGASGSGKSSVVKAGLLHQLKLGQRLSGSNEWKIIIFRPGEHPLKSLVLAFGGAPDELNFTDGLNLAQLVRNTGYPEVVLVADQFEEAFTLCQDLEVRRWFFACLLGALDKPNSNLRVIITMRADFLSKCAEEEYSGLVRKIQDRLVFVEPMNREEFQEAILKPADKVELHVQRELVEQMLSDVEGPASLPLLQYTLRELWENREVNRLTLAAYTKLGGVKRTLEKRAEEVYNSLEAEQQLAAKRIFLELTQLGEGTEDTRRQILKTDLVNEYQSEAVIDETVNKLADARLLVTSELLRRGTGERTVTVDVAHEALIRNWSRLQGWVNENRKAIVIKRQIESEAEEWSRKGKYKYSLRSGALLVEAQSYLENYGKLGLLSKLGKEYIEKSIQQSIQQRKLRNVTLLIVSVVSFMSMARFSTIQWQKAELSALRDDAASVNNLLGSAPVNALILAIKTTGNNKNRGWLLRKILPLVQSSLRDAIVNARERNMFNGHNAQVNSVAFSLDSKYIVSGSDDGTLRLWDINGNATGEPFRGHESDVNSVAFSPDGKYIVSGSDDGTLRLWDIKGNAIGEPFRGHESDVNSVAFSPDGKRIVSGSWDLTIRLWDLEGNLIGEPFRGHESEVYSVAFSSEGKYIVSGSLDNTLRLWDRKGSSIGEPFRGHKNLVLSVAFSPEGKYIVSGSLDNTLRLWYREGTPIGEPLRGHDFPVWSVAFSPEGKYIVSGSDDGTLRLWDIKGNPIGEPFRGHESGVYSVAFSPDGKYIVSGSYDGTLRLWDIKGNTIGEPFRGHDDWVLSVAFSPDGKYILSGSRDNTLRLWDREGNAIDEHFLIDEEHFLGSESYVRAVAFSPDSKYIVSGSYDGTLRLWDIKGNTIGEPFKGHEKVVLSVAFSPDGKYIVSGSLDFTLRLWSREGTSIGEPFRGHNDAVTSVAFSPDGKYIVSGSRDKTLRLWRGGNWEDWLSEACNRLQFHPALAGPEPDAIAKGAVKTCQKHVWDDIEKAEFLIRQGMLLAWQKGDVSGAVAKFKAAHQLDKSVDLPALEALAKKLVSDS